MVIFKFSVFLAVYCYFKNKICQFLLNKTLALAPLSSDPLEFLGYLELCWKYKKVKFLNF